MSVIYDDELWACEERVCVEHSTVGRDGQNIATKPARFFLRRKVTLASNKRMGWKTELILSECRHLVNELFGWAEVYWPLLKVSSSPLSKNQPHKSLSASCCALNRNIRCFDCLLRVIAQKLGLLIVQRSYFARPDVLEEVCRTVGDPCLLRYWFECHIFLLSCSNTFYCFSKRPISVR